MNTLPAEANQPQEGSFLLQFMGRTIEHLGSQMYKHRAPAIAELVANAWDAGAKNVWIKVPQDDSEYSDRHQIAVCDDGEGMESASVQDKYLVIGRNRRADSGGSSYGRKVMGRKGIGKLAGFGLASKMTVTTWTKSSDPIFFSISLPQLKGSAGSINDVRFPWKSTTAKPVDSVSGTQIILSDLKHSSFINIANLRIALSRRFSRVVRGEIKIFVNGLELTEPELSSTFTFPTTGGFESVNLPSGKNIQYRYTFAAKALAQKEMQGFTIYANGRAAQAPPFFSM